MVDDTGGQWITMLAIVVIGLWMLAILWFLERGSNER